MTEIARLNVLVGADVSQLEKKLAGMTAKMQDVGAKMQSVGKTMSLAVTVPMAAIGGASFKMAADAAEAASKMEAVFGGATTSMNAWLTELMETVPATTAELQSMASGIQDLLVPLGMAPNAAQDMTKQVVKLAGDLASFNNIPMDVALEKIRAGMVGQYEPLLDFGVALNAAKVEAKALEMGLIRQGEALDPLERAQAVLALTLQGTTAAHGDAAKTADSASNSMRFLTRDTREAGTTIGQQLLPVLTPLIQRLAEAAKWFSELSPATKNTIVVVAGLTAAAGPLLNVIGLLTKALPAVKLAFAGVSAAVTTLGPLLSTTLPAAFAKVLPFLGPAGLIAAGVAAVFLVWKNWDKIVQIAQGVYTGVKAWMLDKFAAVVDGIKEKIGAVTGAFKGMYNAVVGNSYVPDMISGIGSEFGKLPAVIVQPTAAATARVNASMQQMLVATQSVNASITASHTAMTGTLSEQSKERARQKQEEKAALEDLRAEHKRYGLTTEKVAVQAVAAGDHMRGGLLGVFDSIKKSLGGVLDGLDGFLGKLGGVGDVLKGLIGGDMGKALGGVLDKLGLGGKAGKLITDTLAGMIPGGTLVKAGIGLLAPHAGKILGKVAGKVGGAIKGGLKKLGGFLGFADGGFHTGGLRLVGENGPELEATGPARIYSHAQTRDLLADTGSNDRMVELLEAQIRVNRAAAQENRTLLSEVVRGLDDNRHEIRRLQQVIA